MPLEYYDISYSSKLYETLTSLIECNGNISALSAKLFQHENTLRHRLKKIQDITGLDFKNSEEYEQLSIAIKFYN